MCILVSSLLDAQRECVLVLCCVVIFMQLTRLSTPVRPFELGGEHPFLASMQEKKTSVAAAQEALCADRHARGVGAEAGDVQREHVMDEDMAAAAAAAASAAAAAAAAAAATSAVAKPQEPPEDFFDNVFDCLIMDDPVFAMDGFTYERRRIEEWLASNSR